MAHKNRYKKTKWFWALELAQSGAERCAKCGEAQDLTIDHIVPVSLLKQFLLGSVEDYDLQYNYAQNFQVLCYQCNKQKADKIEIENPRTYEILEKVIAQAKAKHL